MSRKPVHYRAAKGQVWMWQRQLAIARVWLCDDLDNLTGEVTWHDSDKSLDGATWHQNVRRVIIVCYVLLRWTFESIIVVCYYVIPETFLWSVKCLLLYVFCLSRLPHWVTSEVSSYQSVSLYSSANSASADCINTSLFWCYFNIALHFMTM